MRKAVSLILIIAVIGTVFIPLSDTNAMPYFEDATITGDNVNVRMRPTVDSPSVTVLQNGDRIGVFCEEADGWYRIIFGNYRGYIKKEYVFLPSASFKVGHVKETLKLRINPGTYSNVIMTLDAGTGINIIDYIGDWYLVEVVQEDNSDGDDDTQQTEDFDETEPQNVVKGYVHKDYIQLSSGTMAVTLLKKGMSGASIRNMQQKLRKRGFLLVSPTGFFGDMTEAAIKKFQRKAKLPVDGVAGPKTLEALYSDRKISISQAEYFGIKGEVKLSSWSSIKNKFDRGTKALVTDVKTGRQFKVKRTGGTYHADSEPLTSDDTAIMKKIYGGKYNATRRPVWVTVGSTTYAASMYGKPHGSYKISGNNFNGVFCLHFKDSRLHLRGTEREGTVCPRHQAAVQYAYNKGKVLE